MQLMHDCQYIGEQKALMHGECNACPMQCGESESKMHYLWCKDPELSQEKQHHLQLVQK